MGETHTTLTFKNPFAPHTHEPEVCFGVGKQEGEAGYTRCLPVIRIHAVSCISLLVAGVTIAAPSVLMMASGNVTGPHIVFHAELWLVF